MAPDYHVRDSFGNTSVICESGTSLGMNSLASRLKQARLARDLSQPALAKLAGVSQGTVGNIEAGIRGGLNSLAPLAHALQISYWWLRSGDGEMELPRNPWPFSDELAEAMKNANEDLIRKCENLMRLELEMETVRKPADESGKRSAAGGR